MAMRNSQTSSGTFFKPDVRVQYKAVEGKFNFYTPKTETSEAVIELKDSVSYFPIEHFQRFRVKEEGYVSDILVRGTKVFTLKDPNDYFSYVGKYEYDFATQELKTLDGIPARDFSGGNFETASIGILDDDRIAEVTIAGMVQTDLTSKKKGDPEKVKIFKDGSFITLSAEEETVMVGKKPRQKTIHKIKVEGTFDPVPEEILAKGEAVHKLIMAQIKGAGNTSASAEDAEDVFGEDETGNGAGSEGLEDMPY